MQEFRKVHERLRLKHMLDDVEVARIAAQSLKGKEGHQFYHKWVLDTRDRIQGLAEKKQSTLWDMFTTGMRVRTRTFWDKFKGE